jgi:hypothetical protein
MATTFVELPDAALFRLYRLALRWGVSKDRALLFMIDEASQRLSVAEWELSEQQAQHHDAHRGGADDARSWLWPE